MIDGRAVSAQAPNAAAFAPFGAWIEPPADVGGRAMFGEWLDPVKGRALHCHLNRVEPTSLPVKVDRVERHPHAAQLFLPVGVARYLVTVMPSNEAGEPDPRRAQAFVVPGTMGVAYHPETWHAGISVLEAEGSFAVMMWRGDKDDDVFASIEPICVRAAEDAVEGMGDG
ncbi:MAG: ureidoglycolate lyase [Gemmatimonadetes bacterium]|nr:ureidoglycolate lyase [Gemmatimonadota bacterium]MDA1104399.1 ureidoglycolate lyase [Gemmatimonadota bacterium]